MYVFVCNCQDRLMGKYDIWLYTYPVTLKERGQQEAERNSKTINKHLHTLISVYKYIVD